jgi:hypothetical protein
MMKSVVIVLVGLSVMTVLFLMLNKKSCGCNDCGNGSNSSGKSGGIIQPYTSTDDTVTLNENILDAIKYGNIARN